MKKQHFYLMIMCLFSLNFYYYTAKAHDAIKADEKATTSLFHVGVILNLNSKLGKVMKSCIVMAVSDFYSIHGDYSTRLVLHVRNSKGDVVGATLEAVDLIQNVGVQAIIGPETSKEAEVLAYMGNKYQIPIISFAEIITPLPFTQFHYFVQIAKSDLSQVKAIAAIVEAYEWKEVVVIHDDSESGTAVVPYFIDAFQEIGVVIHSRSVLPCSANETLIKSTLHKLSSTKMRIAVVHLSFSLAIRFFSSVNELGMMRAGYVWIVTSDVTDLLGYMDDSILNSMEGVIGVRTHVPPSKALRRFKRRWRRQSMKENHKSRTSELNVHALCAYDTMFIMAMAADAVNSHLVGNSQLVFDSHTTRNVTTLVNMGISPVGSLLLQRILGTLFNGLSGEIQLVDGQLKSSVFEMVNIVKRSSRIVGYWTLRAGVSRSLSLKDLEKHYSANKKNLRVVSWPGGSIAVPSTATLVIGVPMKAGFLEFMNVTRDPNNNSFVMNGFSKDVFDAVMQQLPYQYQYDYVPFNGSYSDLCQQVFYKGLEQKFDAVVGDVTITANRSKYVDFTQPYLTSGVRMIVPIEIDDFTQSLWWFVKPLTRELWFTTISFFLLKGIIIWIFEREINPEFQGSLSQQLGKILSLSFSTMVFTNKEKLESNYSKFIGNLWTFAVFILVTSYSANLTSMLAVENLKPTVTDLDYLRINEKFVGYPEQSFLFQLLKDLGFKTTMLKQLSTPEEYADNLSKGSDNGGVSAVVDEIPYINLFLSKYCHWFTIAGPTYPTGGLGFVFPKDSHLLSDVSQAILDFNEGDHIHQIRKKWFGSETCPDPLVANVTSNELRLYSFRSIYIIMAVASAMTLSFFFASLLYKSVKDGTFTATLTWQELKKRFSSIRGQLFQFGKRKQSLPIPKAEQPARVEERQQILIAMSSGSSDVERDGVEIPHVELNTNNNHSHIIDTDVTASS